jgi:hypothetical protein
MAAAKLLLPMEPMELTDDAKLACVPAGSLWMLSETDTMEERVLACDGVLD